MDTCFLIDLQRDRNNAVDWISQRTDAEFWLCPTVYAEFMSGDRVETDSFASFRRVDLDFSVAETYGTLARTLRATGAMVGVNDLWIGATAIRYDLPVITRNRRDFDRIPGLRVESYG